MEPIGSTTVCTARPEWTAVLELLKPITWFAPMWAYGCGVVSSGVPSGTLARDLGRHRARRAHGVRHQPGRQRLVRPACRRDQRAEPADSFGAHSGPVGPLHRHRLDRAVAAGGDPAGPWGFGAAVVGLALAWAYSAPPIRLKQNGWWGNSAVGACYEGLPWFTGAAVMAAGWPGWPRHPGCAL